MRFEHIDIVNKKALHKNVRRKHIELKGLSDVAYFDEYCGLMYIALVYKSKVVLWDYSLDDYVWGV